MEYDPGRVSLPRTDPAHAVAHVKPTGAARATDRSMVDRKDRALALRQRHDLGARLHARALHSNGSININGWHTPRCGSFAWFLSQKSSETTSRRPDPRYLFAMVSLAHVIEAPVDLRRRRPGPCPQHQRCEPGGAGRGDQSHATEPMRLLRSQVRSGFAQPLESALLQQALPAGLPNRQKPAAALGRPAHGQSRSRSRLGHVDYVDGVARTLGESAGEFRLMTIRMRSAVFLASTFSRIRAR
jgi:hypothetical protein